MGIKIQATLIAADHLCDYVPFLSTATNLTDLFLKAAIVPSPSSTPLHNRYLSHLQQKSAVRSFILLIPLIGNVAIALYDLGKKFSPKPFIPNGAPSSILPPPAKKKETPHSPPVVESEADKEDKSVEEEIPPPPVIEPSEEEIPHSPPVVESETDEEDQSVEEEVPTPPVIEPSEGEIPHSPPAVEPEADKEDKPAKEEVPPPSTTPPIQKEIELSEEETPHSPPAVEPEAGEEDRLAEEKVPTPSTTTPVQEEIEPSNTPPPLLSEKDTPVKEEVPPPSTTPPVQAKITPSNAPQWVDASDAFNAVMEDPSLAKEALQRFGFNHHFIAALMLKRVVVDDAYASRDEVKAIISEGKIISKEYNMASIHPQLLEYMDPSYRTGGHLENLIKYDSRALQYAARKDEKLVALAKEEHKKQYEEFKKGKHPISRDAISRFVDLDPAILKKGAEPVRRDASFVSQLLGVNPQVFPHVDEEMQTEANILAWIQAHPQVYQVIGTHQTNQTLAQAALQEDLSLFSSTPKMLRGDKAFVLPWIEKGDAEKKVVPHLPDSLLQELDFVEQVFVHIPSLASQGDFVRRLPNTPEMLDLLDKQRYGDKTSIPAEHPNNDDEEVVTAAMQKNISSLRGASERMRKDFVFLEKFRLKHNLNSSVVYQYAHYTLRGALARNRDAVLQHHLQTSTDKEFVSLELKGKGYRLKDVGPTFQDDEEVVAIALQDNLSYLSYASKRLQKNELFLRKYQTEHCPGWFDIYEFAHPELRANKAFGLWLVKRNFVSIVFLDSALQGDPDILEAWISHHLDPRSFSQAQLEKTRKNILTYLFKVSYKKNPSLQTNRIFLAHVSPFLGDRHLSQELRTDAEYLAEMLRNDWDIVQTLDKTVKKDAQKMRTLIERYPRYFTTSTNAASIRALLDPALRSNQELANLMVTIHPNLVDFFDEGVQEQIRGTYQVTKPLFDDPSSFKDADTEWKKNRLLVAALSWRDPSIVCHVDPSLRDNNSFILSLIYEDPDRLKKMGFNQERAQSILDQASQDPANWQKAPYFKFLYDELRLTVPDALSEALKAVEAAEQERKQIQLDRIKKNNIAPQYLPKVTPDYSWEQRGILL